MTSKHSHRKDEHVSLAEKFYQADTDSFDQVRFVNQSLPNMAINEITLNATLGTLHLTTPFYFEAISGGSERTKQLNARLAKIAEQTNLAMAVGSQSVALSDPSLVETFRVVRQLNPNGIVIANIGANHSVKDAVAAVRMIDANALEIHVNVAQELIMPEGDRTFAFVDRIGEIVSQLAVPVIVKEVGFGMSQKTIQQLINLGVQYINLSGRGGTNFAKIENFRRPQKEMPYLQNWGLTTIESLLESRPFQKQATFIASGGVKSPLDVAKCLALGSSAVGVAGFFLNQLIKHDDDEIIETIHQWQYGLKAIMLMLGCQNITALQSQKLILSPELMTFIHQRQITY
ncbi:isopentenyl-diphosphate delta-isomerase [Lentilactobacillus fungorum]|uniref:Isopentenyl-diphosphate delta-isomerase n=1 Tax=Lentilactobacillus fungorum TaxID=2201250 RepID=A0ABQ3VX24_9LACO|nr:type 2 isopentenyl-diphosphate Delta-isomerase [Lentilactobacillus fungorum]GHP12782.1 isopentenyl-diphosphate delta-isomerase [Lentilactobacillus fungorum]